MEKQKGKEIIKPKEYTHIDYEAILIYAMKNRVSIATVLAENGLDIARSTVVRKIRKIRNEKSSTIVDLYESQYVPNRQNEQLPEKLQEAIDDLEKKPIIIKPEIEDLYKKLSFMKELVDRCNGNVAEAARVISSGNTILGNVRISTQGLAKNIKNYQRVADELKRQRQEVEGREE